MCGITGFVDFKNQSGKDTLVQMSDDLIHRGPDDSGNEFFETQFYSLGLGFRRLSIIDLSLAGHQPMVDESKKYWIIFNGEVYNFSEIRQELVASGFSFRSNSDTEVILKSYIKWGLDCINKFIGMFSIAIFDSVKKQLVLIRDRAGVKPLFYYSDNDVFLFGSELKSFHRHPGFKKELSYEGITSFLENGFISAPLTIFKNTNKLGAGEYLILDLQSKKIETKKYWNVHDSYSKPVLDVSFEEALSETEKLLKSAFQYRMIADVPIGVFLSGGYDSSCVAALLQSQNTNKIKTYTIGFHEQEYNEAEFAKKVAGYLGTDHFEYYCTEKEAIDLVPLLPVIYDEPFADPSAIPTTLVSKIARQHVTVALSADGGDEIFAGYPRHLKSLNLINKFQRINSTLGKFASRFINENIERLDHPNRKGKLKDFLSSNSGIEKFVTINQTFTSSEIKKLTNNQAGRNDAVTKKFIPGRDLLSEILAYEYSNYLADDILQKVDRASMFNSLEGREPFLDQRVVEYVGQLPSHYKLKDGRQKILLKEIVHKYIPKEIMERPKMGFGVPLEKWFKNELKELVVDVLDPVKVKNAGVFNVEVIANMLDDFQNGRFHHFQRFYTVFVMQQWLNRWM